jgi:predicted dehydrogenase
MSLFNVALIGTGGFGRTHVKTILNLAEQGIVRCAAFCEIDVERNREQIDKLQALGAVHYTDYKKMLEETVGEVEAVVIATPIALHQPMAAAALTNGFHVLLEKPPVVTVPAFQELLAVQQAANRLVQVNFQNTCAPAFRAMLEKLQAGEIGDVTDVTGIGKWRRSYSYYARTPWAGRKYYNGQPVLDGTIMNPFSHLLNNCLIAAGRGDATLASPLSVQAELYHAYDIEGDDTSCLRVETQGGASVHFYSTLCHVSDSPTSIEVTGTAGRMKWIGDTLHITSVDGSEKALQYDNLSLIEEMYINLRNVVRDSANDTLYSPLEACGSFLKATDGAFASTVETWAIDSTFTREYQENDSAFRTVTDISEMIDSAAAQRKLFSEAGVPWARKTKPYLVSGSPRV